MFFQNVGALIGTAVNILDEVIEDIKKGYDN